MTWVGVMYYPKRLLTRAPSPDFFFLFFLDPFSSG